MKFVPYATRPISFLELWEHHSWRMKIYGIAYGQSRPDPEFVDRGKQLASSLLDQATEHYGVGFMGVHQGKTEHFIFVDWWSRENELNHHVFTAPPEKPLEFTNRTASGVMACVWDLAVIGHERTAWIETVLKPGVTDNFEAYLSKHLKGDI